MTRSLPDASGKQLRQALVNRGYMDASVKIDTTARYADKKISVEYIISPGLPHRIASFNTLIDNALIDSLISASSDIKPLQQGDLFDRNRLDNLRTDIATMLRNNGFYSFTKENISFMADTVSGNKEIDLTMVVRAASRGKADADIATVPLEEAPLYTIDKVIINTDISTSPSEHNHPSDTILYHGIYIVYGTPLPTALNFAREMLPRAGTALQHHQR